MNLTDLRKEKEFSVLEISKLFRITKPTVFNWIKRGLVYRSTRKGNLISGQNVKFYLNQFNENGI